MPVVAVVPKVRFRSRVQNGLIILANVSGRVFLAVVVWALVDLDYHRDTGMGLAYAMMFAVPYISTMGLTSTADATWAWLGLRGGARDACR